jgi:hypothetical protein
MPKKKKGFRDSKHLAVIEKFGVEIAQSVVGGEITRPNDPNGDLYHDGQNAYFEVKASGTSSGAIIVKDQLERHLDNLERQEQYYVFVFYLNRVWQNGRFLYTTLRNAKTRLALENFLVKNLREIQIVHVEVIDSIFRYQSKLGRVRTYVMKRGPKTYVKIRGEEVRSLAVGDTELGKFGFDPGKFSVSNGRKTIRFKGFRRKISFLKIEPKPDQIKSDIPF